jgi:thiopurine S-methyltransferase
VGATFWHQKWEQNDIAFHEREPNPFLIKYFDLLSLLKESRVFLPLCGKTLAIHWLLLNGYRVAGSELIEIAVEQLFSELGIEPNITAIDEIRCYSADNVGVCVYLSITMSRHAQMGIDRCPLGQCCSSRPDKTLSWA